MAQAPGFPELLEGRAGRAFHINNPFVEGMGVSVAFCFRMGGIVPAREVIHEGVEVAVQDPMTDVGKAEHEFGFLDGVAAIQGFCKHLGTETSKSSSVDQAAQCNSARLAALIMVEHVWTLGASGKVADGFGIKRAFSPKFGKDLVGKDEV